MGDKARAGDGVIAGAGRVDGRPVFCYAQDPSYLGGSLGEQHAESIIRVMRLAGRAGVPLVGFIESGGARMQEGLAALGGYGRIFRENVALSGRIPQISVICGASAGGGSYSPALTDFVVMTERATMFLTGPAVVRDVMGEDVTADDLGGPKVHDRNGVAHFVVPSDEHAAMLVRDLLDHLPANSGDRPPRFRSAEPNTLDPSDAVPDDERRVYDVRDVVKGIVDGGRLLEWAPRWARNIVCGFARLEGRAVGVVANQPRYLGGVLDADSGSKAARFVRTCNAFGLPLVVLVDTPGFMPGTRQEQGGVIRHGAKLVHAFAEAHVPKVTLVRAQGVRRRVHRHELPRPRRGLHLRVARRDARRHGRQAGRRHRQPPRHRGRRGSRDGPRGVRRPLHGRAPQRRHRRRRGLRRRGHRADRHPPAPDRSPEHPRFGGRPGRRDSDHDRSSTRL